MKLRALHITYLPGIEERVPVSGFGDGLNVIHGPNGIGKSSVCRLVQAMLWPTPPRVRGVRAHGLWDIDGQTWRVDISGRVTWTRDGQPADPPPVPPEDLAACFSVGMRDLLQPDGQDDRALAGEVRKLMAGGVDLPALEERFAVKRNAGRHEDSALTDARDDLQRVQNKRRALEDEEDRLQELKEERNRADRLSRDAVLLDRARELSEQRVRLVEAEARLGGFHADMKLMRGGELEHVRQHRGDIEQNRGEREEYAQAILEADAELADCELPSGPVPAEEDAKWRKRIHAFEQLEEKRHLENDRLAECQAAVREAWEALGGRVNAEHMNVDSEMLSGVEKWLDAETRINQQKQALETRINTIRRGLTEGLPPRAALYTACDALRHWLRSEHTAARPAVWQGRVAWIVFAALSVTGLLCAVVVDPWFAALAGAGVLGLVLSFIAPKSAAQHIGMWESNFNETGIEPPAAWTSDAVSRRLRECEALCARVERDEQDRNEIARCRGEREGVDRELATNQQRRTQMCEELGIDPGGASLDIADKARAVVTWRSVEDQRTRTEALVAQLDKQVTDVRQAVTAFLEGYGIPSPEDGTDAMASLDNLRARSGRYLQAQQKKATAIRERDGRDSRLQELESRMAAILGRVGLGSAGGDAIAILEQRTQDFEAYTQARRVVDDCTEAITVLEQQLRAAKRDDLIEADASSVEEFLHEAEDAQTRLQDLTKEISDIERGIRAAVDSTALEDASSAVEQAEAHLAQAYRDARRKLAARFLVQRVAHEFEQAHQPEVFREASRMLSRFTAGQYRLELDKTDDGTAFRAVDRSEQGFALNQLSDGTRIQLLLAARMAFAARASREAPVPLFVDEALANSDPGRKRAVIECLADLSREGWQIVYCTSDPADVHRIQNVFRSASSQGVPEFDLGRIRRQAGAASALDFDVTLPAIPEPDGMSAEAYADVLAVPRADFHRPAGDLHLVYLLHDKLALLHKLLEARVETLGQWKTLDKSGAASSLAETEESELLTIRRTIAEELLRLAKVGRGRPADRRALEASEAVSPKYIEGAAAVLDELHGDAEQFLDVLSARSDERISGFRKQKVKDLREYFDAEGYLDAAEPFNGDSVIPELLSGVDVQRLIQQGAVDVAGVTEQAVRLWSCLEMPRSATD